MLAKELAAKLMEHPECDVIITHTKWVEKKHSLVTKEFYINEVEDYNADQKQQLIITVDKW